MAKYMVLYSSTTSATQLMADASSEQMKASMNEWLKWKADANKTAQVVFGMPLQAVRHITPDGAGPSSSQVSGYATVEGDSKNVIVELLQTHPHLKRSGASFDLLEMVTMPGM